MEREKVISSKNVDFEKDRRLFDVSHRCPGMRLYIPAMWLVGRVLGFSNNHEQIMLLLKLTFIFILALISPQEVHTDVPSNQQAQHVFVRPAGPKIKKVAIIGAGAAGSSAAYWLRGAFPPGN